MVFDLEADALELDKVTKVHCLWLREDDGKLIGFTDSDGYNRAGNVAEGIKRLAASGTLIGHNIVWFDLPTLEKLYGLKYRDTVIDTLLLSRLLNPDRVRPIDYTGKAGPHSIECWGHRLGRSPKIQIQSWDALTPDMWQRCSEDVETNWLVYQQLVREANT